MSGTALILGGVRSGKSRFGQELAARLGGDDVLFVATAQAGDAEMSRRIQHHRRERPAAWSTLEQPLDVGKAIGQLTWTRPVILLDCLTLLVSNVLMRFGTDAAEQAVLAEIDELISAAARAQASLIVVSGEVGLGLVPESSVGRVYRDLLGWANQRISQEAKATYWMVAGAAVNVTASASTAQRAADEFITDSLSRR